MAASIDSHSYEPQVFMIQDTLLSLKTTFATRPFNESDVAASPFLQFQQWFDEALQVDINEANAMVLATASPTGQPSARVVLLRNMDDRGFVFFTNYESHKGQDIAANPQVELLFYWQALGRQVRIQGSIEKVSEAESLEYFQERPRDSRIGAWASRQSSVLSSRAVLEQRVQDYEKKFDSTDVPLPPFWGGYRVLPQHVEFWQGRESRLHDRIRYRRVDGIWIIERLSP